SHSRKNSVELVEGEFLLISAGNLEDLESFTRSKSATHRILLLSGALVRIRLPRGAHAEVALCHVDVGEANPRSPTGLARPLRCRRITREDALVIPLSTGRLLDDDNRAHQLHVSKIDSLAAQRGESVARPHLVGLDERPVGAVGEHDIMQRESAQQIPGVFADVDEAVTVAANPVFDVAT